MSHSNDSVSAVSAKPRNRHVSSRFMSLSPASTGSPESPTGAVSPVRSINRFTSTDSRRHGYCRSSSSLADQISNDRIREREHRHHDREEPTKTPSSIFSLRRQRNCKELKNDNGSSKENDRPSVVVAGSQRHTGKFNFRGKPSSSSSSTISPSSSMKMQSSSDSCIGLGRFSLDESAMHKKSLSSSSRNPEYYVTTSVDSGPGCFDSPSRTTSSSKKPGREVFSKYMTTDVARRVPRWIQSDSDASNPHSFDESTTTMMTKCTVQKGTRTTLKRANSLSSYKSSMSQWALSPGRSGSPTMCVENKEKKVPSSSFSSLRPHGNKSVDKILSMGFDLFRGRKASSPGNSSGVGLGSSEDFHVLRLLDNRLVQWRFANARAQAVNENVSRQAESNMICALDGVTTLKHSVMQKRIQLEREKLKMKLDFVLHSQMKLLEIWGGMERQHLAAIDVTQECLHSVVCKVPLLEGVKVDIQSAFISQQHASDLTSSIKSMLTSFSPSADKTAELLSELAEIVSQEKLLLEEFYDLFRTISILELKERNLKCSLIQLQC